MNRFRRIFLAVTLLVILAAAGWKLTRPRLPIAISGNFSPADVEQITAAVRHNLRKDIMPDFSWASFKRLPADLKFNLQYEISSIHEDSVMGVMVEIKGSHKSAYAEIACLMIRGTKGWEVKTNGFGPEIGTYVPLWQGPFPTFSSDQTNSNGSK
jgi:hypothetical protein